MWISYFLKYSDIVDFFWILLVLAYLKSNILVLLVLSFIFAHLIDKK